jgi:hypothetical protein
MPRQLAYRPPSDSVARSEDRDDKIEHLIEARFTVTKEGRIADVVVDTAGATESQQKSLLAAVKKACYAPRLDAGETVDTTGVKLTERMLSKKPRSG